MVKECINEVLQTIANECTDKPCGNCCFNELDEGCPFMLAPTHWDIDGIVEIVDKIIG